MYCIVYPCPPCLIVSEPKTVFHILLTIRAKKTGERERKREREREKQRQFVLYDKVEFISQRFKHKRALNPFNDIFKLIRIVIFFVEVIY